MHLIQIIYLYFKTYLYIFFRTQLDRHESNIDLLEHRLEKVIICYFRNFKSYYQLIITYINI